LSESRSSGRGADSDDEENIKGIDGEEEEKENPLPATQEQEEDSEAGQQSQRQSEEEEEEQQEEDEVEEPREEVQGAAMAEKCNMTPRLQFRYGNSKDWTSIEWWCDAVDRIKDQKGWNDDQGKKSAASVAVEALREDASLLMSLIASRGGRRRVQRSRSSGRKQPMTATRSGRKSSWKGVRAGRIGRS
jgi:hypothetical protein